MRPTEPGTGRPARADDVDQLVVELAALLVAWSFEGTVSTEDRLTRVARAYGKEIEAVVLADAAIVTVGGVTRVAAGHPDIPALDQIAALNDLIDAIEADPPPVAVARARVAELRAQPGRFGPALRVLGAVLFTIGFGVSIQATWQEVVAAGLGGVVVGLAFVAMLSRPRLALVAPLISSTVVSIAAISAYEHGWIHGGPIQLMAPVLFLFIPGDALSAGALELAAGRYTAGASRLVYSFFVLVFLGLGAVLALGLLGADASDLFDPDVVSTLPWWGVWFGWVLFAVGVMLVFSMRPRDFPWALVTILLTFGAAQLGTWAFGEIPGTFLGAMAMTALVLVLSRPVGRPAPYVLFLGAFFVLTPGSRGLRGLETLVGGNAIDGLRDIGLMVGMLAAIALGILTLAALLPARWTRGMLP
ncbi:threonine/serine exporter ThrE family protein [Cellulomonas sp. PhB150]|uniref:threonine/serine ThrE exporter family protein n=1 Tax=Cellulomonas sp. PhB150 TaxID=2485188 RepID=UPI000F46575D|nr:threonine/serine exporter family protein [Cellulomonas sp. PhB150]ROS27897.1 uncharacterized membrane protein YjjP (DUF1212 family) [Cellulomonas sp. PhB150]